MAKTPETQDPRVPVNLSELNVKNRPPEGSTTTHGAVRTPVVSQPDFEPPAEEAPLPSHGYLYKDVTTDKLILSGRIMIRPMTMVEEKILATSRLIKTGQALDMMFRNCIKSDIDPKDLLSSDRIFLMFWLRALSYGAEYEFTLHCPNPTCTKKFKYRVDIKQQPIKEIAKDFTEPVELKLPKSGATIFYKLPRGRTEEQARALRDKAAVKFSEVDNAATDRLQLLIDRIITPEGEELNPNLWDKFLNSLLAYDSAIIREDMNGKDAGIEPVKDIQCPYCDEMFDEEIPITAEFFRIGR